MEEGAKPPYDPLLDCARVALEFGYVLMFTVVWPLTPLACLVISALEQRAAAPPLHLEPPADRAALQPARTVVWRLPFLAWLSVPVK